MPAHSIGTWAELEQKFHAYFFTGTNEKKLVDLISLRQRVGETPQEYLRRFRETKNLCYSLNLPDDQLPGMAIAGMQPNVREKLFGMEFDDLGQLSQRLAIMSNQAQGFKRDTRFQRGNAANEMYQSFLEEAAEYDDEDEIAAAELTWAKEPVQVSQRWLRSQKGTYDFDVTKADRLFELLVKEGRIKLPEGHPMLRPEGVKDKRYCGYHNTNSHSINDCRVFRVRIQKAIQEGHLKFDGKMKIDGQPFPQNMVSFSVGMVSANDPKGKGKMKVLTSDRARENGTVDPNRQITSEELRQKIQVKDGRIEKGESSKPRITSRILLNKWQRQQEKEYYERRRYMEERQRREEELYRREQERSHWDCSFFKYCWNEGLKLPTRDNCPECSDQYSEYRQSRVNRRSVHERLGMRSPGDSRRFEKEKYSDNNKTHHGVHDVEESSHRYVWQEGQWCPPGLRKTQKRRVQRLRNEELKRAVAEKKQVWRPKKPDGSGPSADACMAFFIPLEFVAPENQDVQEEVYSDFDDSEIQELMAQLVLTQQAIFDKPAKHRHLKPLYLKGYVNGKPLTKMFVDGGAAINIMPYTTFKKLGMTSEDLLKTDMVLRDFAGNPSDTRGAVHVELMIGSKTLITTFFVIDGKGAYSLLLGRDWIHANCCIPSTMHQILVQWVGEGVEVIHADDSVSVAAAEPAYWEYDGVECFSGRVWEEGPVNVFSRDQQPIQAVGSHSNF